MCRSMNSNRGHYQQLTSLVHFSVKIVEWKVSCEMRCAAANGALMKAFFSRGHHTPLSCSAAAECQDGWVGGWVGWRILCGKSIKSHGRSHENQVSSTRKCLKISHLSIFSVNLQIASFDLRPHTKLIAHQLHGSHLCETGLLRRIYFRVISVITPRLPTGGVWREFIIVFLLAAWGLCERQAGGWAGGVLSTRAGLSTAAVSSRTTLPPTIFPFRS